MLYGASTSLPALLQSLFGYDATTLAWSCRRQGFSAVVALPVVGLLLGRGDDARWMIVAGLLVMAVGSYWMAHTEPHISPGQVVWPRVVLVFGLR